ncbi:barstar family protein [Actinomadura algeriensis]|uniref:Asparagine synthetase B (Glutamine-hydrolyzing) n=1 Tax=Actinomadura algeriensis TaxID=1679523 RepID=A0ABR9JPL3_9ACTN|nr:barstar family protein [Actinomadura algeriensis]MBE1532353.1 asparagine synthetase B (glutamine-hydrolyzing) [Actinomadura algeriensis]
MDANRALDELIAGRVTPDVYQWRTLPAAGALGDTTWTERAAAAGRRGFHLDGRHACDSDGFLRMCRETFEFPEGVGTTWDALESALTDLSWAPAEHGYVVLYESWSELAEEDQPAFRAALDLFASAVKRRRDTATPMTVLLSSVGVEVAGVPRLA